MKTIYGIIIVSMFSITGVHAQSEFEIFPLKKNIHYTYDYYLKKWTTQSLITWNNAIDSGSVEYIVGDPSSENDSTRVWNVLEIKSLRRWHLLPQDTTYNIQDTTRLSLFEYTTGSHALRADGFLWKFSVGEPAMTVFRYDTSMHKEITQRWSSGQYPLDVTYGTDSLAFRDSMGLAYSYSKWDTHEGLMGNGGGGFKEAHLRSSPVTHAPMPSHVVTGFQLNQNYPNPFNPETNIEFELPASSYTTLTIFDILGRQTEVLLAKQLTKGSYSCMWNASRYPSGVYFYCLQSGNYRQTKKMLLQK